MLVDHMQFSSNNVTLCISGNLAKCISFVRLKTALCTTLASSFILLLFPCLSYIFFFWLLCELLRSFFIPGNRRCHFIYILSLVSGADKTKFQMLQILLPSVMTLSSSHLFTALDAWAKSCQLWKKMLLFCGFKVFYHNQIEKQKCLINIIFCWSTKFL